MTTTEAGLTESQIDKLLREAEERLAEKHSLVVPVASGELLQTPSAQRAATEAVADAREEAAAPKKDDVSLRIVKAEKRKDKKKSTPDSAGPDWYGLPKTILTPEAKRDFQILRMRGILDPKQHFRKDNRKDMVPKFSVFGTIVEGGLDGERQRLTRKERKRTIVEEVLAAERDSRAFKKRYLKVQEKKASGKKGFYKKLVAQRRRRP